MSQPEFNLRDLRPNTEVMTRDGRMAVYLGTNCDTLGLVQHDRELRDRIPHPNRIYVHLNNGRSDTTKDYEHDIVSVWRFEEPPY